MLRKSIFFIVLAIFQACAFAQSKKELVTEVAALKSQIAALTAEITSLKMPKEADISNDNKKASYGLGVLMASNVKNQGADSLDLESLSLAIRDVLQNKPLKLQQQECLPIVQQYMQAASLKKGEKAKREGILFLEKNKTQPGITTTASGLQYKILTKGLGKAPTPTDNVTVHYTGKLIDGTEFDSSVRRGEPITHSASGFVKGLQLMHEGDKWMLYIPQELGYGERGSGQIPPYAALIFEIELIKVN
jgi:FKBP-type peptidyl-prolyl cis-trans isomerase FklB